MRRLLIATMLAASTLSFAGAAMAAANARNSGQVTTVSDIIVGNSSGSYIAHQSAMYKTDNGQ